MAVDPVMVADYRHAHNSNKDKAEWAWVWDDGRKEGRWVMQEEQTRGASSGSRSRPREKVTLEQLDEEGRKEKEARAKVLRQQSAKRLRDRQAQKEMKEMKQEDEFRRALEDRKKELEAKRSNITAGLRIRPTEVAFDDVELPEMQEDIGEGVIRAPEPPRIRGQSARPGWNSGVGPSGAGPRVGFQPGSLIPPPPALPPKSRGGQSFNSSANASRAASAPRSRAAGARAPGTEESVLDAALKRADQGIERAREISFGLQSYSQPRYQDQSRAEEEEEQGYQEYEDDVFEDEDVDDAYGYGGYGAEDMQYAYSGRTSPASMVSQAPSSVVFWNNRAKCGSESGAGRERDSDVGSVSSYSGAGSYKRQVDAIKDQILGLKKQVDSPLDSNRSGRKPSPTPSSRSARSALSTACSSRTARSRTESASGNRVGTGQTDSGSGGSSGGSNRGNSGHGQQGSILMRRKGATPPQASSARYGSPQGQAGLAMPTKLVVKTNIESARRPPGHQGARWAHEPEGFQNPTGNQSKVRQGLKAARQQAELLDSLDLDSPAHRAAYRQPQHCPDGAVHGRQPQAAEEPRHSLLESLDLSSSGQLGGAVRADMWLKQAVQSALGADAALPRAPASAATAAPPDPQRNRFGFKVAAQQIPVVSGPSRGPPSRGDQGPVPSSAARHILRKSRELLKKHSSKAKELLADHRKNKQQPDSSHRSPQIHLSSGHARPPESRGQSARAIPQHRIGRTPAYPSRQENAPLQPRHAQAGPSSRPAVTESVAIDAEERALLQSLARLDKRLMMAADPAAAYVAAQERVEAEEARTTRRESNFADVPTHKIKVVQAPALDHWNRREELESYAMAQRQIGSAKGNSNTAFPGVRDRRVINTKNK